MHTPACIAAIACMGLIAGHGYAAESTWTIDIRGLEKYTNGEFPGDPPVPVNTVTVIDGSGHFTGFDSNRDGVLKTSEISSLDLLGEYVWPSFAGDTPDFSYSDQGGLHLIASGYRVSVNFGNSVFVALENFGTRSYIWTATTATVIEGPSLAVPEPRIYALLLSALGLVGFAARRQRIRQAA